MNILDIRQPLDDRGYSVYYEPFKFLDGNIVCRKIVESVTETEVHGYYKYNLNDKTFRRFDSCAMNIEYQYLWYFYLENIYFIASEIKDDKKILHFFELDMDTEAQREVLKLTLELEQFFRPIEVIDGHIIYLIEDDISDEEYDEYKNLHGYYLHMFLYDIESQNNYEVLDKSICLSVGDFEVLQSNGEDYLFIEERYMESYEKEEAYKMKITPESFYIGYQESIRLLPFKSFLSDVKAGLETITGIEIDRTGLNESLRYVGMNDNFIFYKHRSFISKNEKLISIDKNTFEKESIYLPKKYSYLKVDGNTVFALVENEHLVMAKEIIGKRIVLTYPGTVIKEIGDESFFKFIEDRYVLLSGWEENENSLDYYTKMYDINTGEITKYEGNVEVLDGNVILY